jgi:hypothetical protein
MVIVSAFLLWYSMNKTGPAECPREFIYLSSPTRQLKLEREG